MALSKTDPETDEEAIRIEIRGIDAMRSWSPVWPSLVAVGLALNFWGRTLPPPNSAGTQTIAYLLAGFSLTRALKPTVWLPILGIAALIANGWTYTAEPLAPMVMPFWKRVVGGAYLTVLLFDWLGAIALLAALSYDRLLAMVGEGGPKLTLDDPEDADSQE